MFRFSRFAMIMGLAGITAGLPSLAQQRARDDDGMAEAIRFERAKQAAADRQARIEAGQEREEHSADRMMSETRHKTRAAKDRAARKDQQQERESRQQPK